MNTFQEILRQNIILIELLCVISGLLNYKKFKKSSWRYFIYYVVFIFIFEFIGIYILSSNVKGIYYEYLVIPFQFIFFFWLYAINSLKRTTLFWRILIIYLLTFILTHYLDAVKTRIINEVSYSVGCLLLLILIILEFIKQIKSDNILNFKKDTMFYVNLGVALFYIGTLPFFAFDGFAFENMKLLWKNYWTLFLILNYVLYSIFIIAFIWTKPNT